MTTFTTQGFSRTVDYETGLYGNFQNASLQVIRQDGEGDFVYHYNWIDDTGMSPPMVQIFDPWSHSFIVSPGGANAPIDLVNGMDFVERQVSAVDWGNGKTTYLLTTFQPTEGIETIFVMGGDPLPPITNEAELDAFLANGFSYVLEGPFEGGNEIPLSGFLNTTSTENDVVTAIPEVALYWNAGVGDDTVTGGLTNDTLIGGAGNDVMSSGGGSDSLMGMTGDDILTGTGFFTFMSGGAGNDMLYGNSDFGDQMQGDAGNDLIQFSDGQVYGETRISHSHANGGSGDDTIEGGLAGDLAHGGNGNDILNGRAGEDVLEGGYGNDTINGGADNDRLSGGGNNDKILGGTGSDMIEGGNGKDILKGEGGSDTIFGGNGNDKLVGGTQGDQLSGDLGNDTLLGGAQNDTVDGGDGNDLVQGNNGNDNLIGGIGDDTLIGGANTDTMSGGIGADVFKFVAVSDSAVSAMDQITDFEVGIDLIDLQKIDAVAGVVGNQAFEFIGAAAFTAAGQARATIHDGDMIVELNTSGSSGAEMAFLLQGVTTLSGLDFLL